MGQALGGFLEQAKRGGSDKKDASVRSWALVRMRAHPEEPIVRISRERDITSMQAN